MVDNAKHLERLSALADGELSQLEIRQVLRDSDGCSQSKRQWRSTHLLRSMASKERLDFSHIDISAKVSAAIKEQPAPKRQFSISPQFGKMAIAASVAMAAVFGVQFWQVQDVPSHSFATNQNSVTQLNRAFQVPQVATRNVATGTSVMSTAAPQQLNQADWQRLQRVIDGNAAPSQETRTHLERLMAEHAQISASLDGQNLLQRARFSVTPAELSKKTNTDAKSSAKTSTQDESN